MKGAAVKFVVEVDDFTVRELLQQLSKYSATNYCSSPESSKVHRF